MGGMNILDELLTVGKEEDEKIKPKEYISTLEELVSEQQALVDLTVGKLESDIKMLEAKRDALEKTD